MASHVRKQVRLRIGEPTIFDCASPVAEHLVVFEDDGETGYFYAVNPAEGDHQILDALHVYNAAADRGEEPVDLQVIWSVDGLKAVLVINGVPQAAFDFSVRRGYCRTGFPPSSGDWSIEGHEWDDEVLERFR